MSFNEGDKVRVMTKNTTHEGKTGKVVSVHDDNTLIVRLEQGNLAGTVTGFFASELEPVDEKQEALIELAETLDKARLQANAIDVYTIESQLGVYGDIVRALTDTLEALSGHINPDKDDHAWIAGRIYGDMLESGNTVREALKVVGK